MTDDAVLYLIYIALLAGVFALAGFIHDTFFGRDE